MATKAASEKIKAITKPHKKTIQRGRKRIESPPSLKLRLFSGVPRLKEGF